MLTILFFGSRELEEEEEAAVQLQVLLVVRMKLWRDQDGLAEEGIWRRHPN